MAGFRQPVGGEKLPNQKLCFKRHPSETVSAARKGDGQNGGANQAGLRPPWTHQGSKETKIQD
jgi:hypothetical protein